MIRIAVDAMGGDYAPAAVVRGAVETVADDVAITLVGSAASIERELAQFGRPGKRIRVEHADEAVGMAEPATTPIRRKPNSSIRRCAELVAAGEAQAMVSAGNTGAAVISARMVIGALEGVDRPALAAVFPSRSGRTVVLDVGANIDSKPSHLRQFAVMGHFYAREILGSAEPRVGLLSIGQEEGKGTDLTREVASVLKTTGLNFIGNVEGRDVFSGSADVVVCDGFVGNAVLKSAESLAELITEMTREELARSWRARLGLALARPAIEALQRRTDYEELGAVPLLGVRGGCFIAHGRSSSRAVASAIRSAAEFSTARLPLKIRDSVAELHRQERRLLGAGGSAREVAAEEIPV
jgi:glycerol-3-phosphate acyltransferase PlsX